MSCAIVILAAGRGTRMQSDLPKVLHKVAHAPMLFHAMQSGQSLGPERQIIVAGFGADQVIKAASAFAPEVQIVIQKEQNGTAHAVAQARELLEDFRGDVTVLYGDTPFISPATLRKMQAARAHHQVVVLGFEAKDPARYGRLITDGAQLTRIVEFKDASETEKAITLCNSGVICADNNLLFDLISSVKNDNATGEYYLTDIVALARARGQSVGFTLCDEAETMGINSRQELSQAEAIYQTRHRQEALENGISMQAPETVHFAFDTYIGRDAIIEPYVVFGPGVTIESEAQIRAFSHLEGCHVASGAVIGPYARLRPGAEIGAEARVGNFVEVKNAEIGRGSKANHLTYIGDATIGENSNIGAGTVTCNYDGVMKHHTHIGDNSAIGSDTMLVAPIRVGNEAMTGSGSVITRDVPDGALALGRNVQVNKEGFTRKYRAHLQQKKLKKKD